jgi:hypothetical protein
MRIEVCLGNFSREFLYMLTREELTPERVLQEIAIISENSYGNGNVPVVERVLTDVVNLFNGRRAGFQCCDIAYHDLFHTLQTVPPFIEIIDGLNISGFSPRISKEFYELGVIAVLLHDTGYIKNEGDNDGTGAKYTFTHIQRSIQFAQEYLTEIGFDADKILTVQNAIQCTGVSFSVDRIAFPCEESRIIGYALGTADLLGQMSSPDYLEKLPVLYREFEEAYTREGVQSLRRQGVCVFESPTHLLNSTPSFYENVTMGRFRKMGSLYQFLSYRYDDHRNPYIEAIENNIRRLNCK